MKWNTEGIQDRIGSLANQEVGHSNHQKHNCMPRMKSAYRSDNQPTEQTRRLDWLSQMEARHYAVHKSLLVRQPTIYIVHTFCKACTLQGW